MKQRHPPLLSRVTTDAAHLLSALADRSRIWVGVAAIRTVSEPGRDWRPAGRALATVAVQSALIHFAIKPIFGRARPSAQVRSRFGMRRPVSGSFPSGHSASAMTAALLLADGRRGWNGPLIALALAIASSRVAVGLHHRSDVIGGALLGTLTGVVVKRFLPLTRMRIR